MALQLTHFNVRTVAGTVVVRPSAPDLKWLFGFAEYYPDERTQRFHDELMSVADSADGRVVLDLTGFDFVGNDTIAMIIRFHQRVQDRGSRLGVAGSRDLQLVFELTKLNQLFACGESVDQVAAALSPDTD